MTQNCVMDILASEYRIGEGDMSDEEFFAIVFAFDRKLSKIKNSEYVVQQEQLFALLKNIIDKKINENELIYDNTEISKIMSADANREEKLQEIFRVVAEKRCESDANLSSKNYRALTMQKEMLENKSDTYLELVDKIKTTSKIINDKDILERFIKTQGEQK